MTNENWEIPKVEINANLLDYWCASLSKAGYGSFDLIKGYDSATLISILDYESFINDFQREAEAINRR